MPKTTTGHRFDVDKARDALLRYREAEDAPASIANEIADHLEDALRVVPPFRGAQPATFSLDSLDHELDGYTFGDTWNGWACPYFTKEQADEVLDALSTGCERAEYDEERDAYVFKYPELEQPETFPRDEETGLFPIGAYCWTWDRVDTPPEAGNR